MKRRKADDGQRLIFRTHLKEKIAWTTVETGMTQGGVPDSNYLCDNGVEGWVEYKATDANAIKFQPEQVGWLHRRARYGGIAWISVRKRHFGGPLLGDAIDELYLFSCRHVYELKAGGVNCGHGLFMGGGGPTLWNWQAVRSLLDGTTVPRF